MKKLKVLLFIIIFLITGDIMAHQNTFSIYLPAEKIPVDQILGKNLQEIKLQDKPILSIDDIISYDKDTHKITLTSSAYNRFMDLDAGTPFIVCVGDERIYMGAIWSDLYSTSFGGIVISKPVKRENSVIDIVLGYPSQHFFKGTDFRSDPRIFYSLEQAGKLKDNSK